MVGVHFHLHMQDTKDLMIVILIRDGLGLFLQKSKGRHVMKHERRKGSTDSRAFKVSSQCQSNDIQSCGVPSLQPEKLHLVHHGLASRSSFSARVSAGTAVLPDV